MIRADLDPRAIYQKKKWETAGNGFQWFWQSTKKGNLF